MIKVKIQLSYRLVPYEVEIEASDQTDLTYVLGECFLKSIKAGFEATEYELTARAYLTLMLDSTKLDDLLNELLKMLH